MRVFVSALRVGYQEPQPGDFCGPSCGQVVTVSLEKVRLVRQLSTLSID